MVRARTDLQPERLERRDECRMPVVVPGLAVLHPLFVGELEHLGEREDERAGHVWCRRSSCSKLRRPSSSNTSCTGRYAALNPRDRLGAERDECEARDTRSVPSGYRSTGVEPQIVDRHFDQRGRGAGRRRRALRPRERARPGLESGCRTPVDASPCTRTTRRGRPFSSTRSRASGCNGEPHGASTRTTSAPSRPAASASLSPAKPITPTATTSPGSIRFASTASRPASSLPGKMKVSGLSVRQRSRSRLRAWSSTPRNSGSLAPWSVAINPCLARGDGLLRSGPSSVRSLGLRRRYVIAASAIGGQAAFAWSWRSSGRTNSPRHGSVVEPRRCFAGNRSPLRRDIVDAAEERGIASERDLHHPVEASASPVPPWAFLPSRSHSARCSQPQPTCEMWYARGSARPRTTGGGAARRGCPRSP